MLKSVVVLKENRTLLQGNDQEEQHCHCKSRLNGPLSHAHLDQGVPCESHKEVVLSPCVQLLQASHNR